jgi:hypothetical protein
VENVKFIEQYNAAMSTGIRAANERRTARTGGRSLATEVYAARAQAAGHQAPPQLDSQLEFAERVDADTLFSEKYCEQVYERRTKAERSGT